MAKKTFEERIKQNITWLKNDKERKKQEIKDGIEALKNQLDSSIIKKFEDEILEYMKLLEEYDNKLLTPFNERYEELNKFENNSNSCNEKSLDQQSRNEKKKVEKSSINHTIIPNNNIKELENKINNSLMQLSKQLEALSKSNTSNEIKDIKKKIDSLKVDLSYEIKQQFDKRKDTDEVIETLPVKLDDLSKKIDSIESSSDSKKSLEIPKDEQVIVDLTKFMKDGLEQLENIGRYYISKQSEFEKLEIQNKNHQDALNQAKDEGLKDGAKSEQIRLAKDIFTKFPEKFKEIKSIFEDIVTEEYQVDEEIEITQENRQKYELKIAGITQDSKVVIQSPALLIAGEVVEKATIKESK